MGVGGFPAEREKKRGAHRIGAAISGPRIAGGKIIDVRFFLQDVFFCQERMSGKVGIIEPAT